MRGRRFVFPLVLSGLIACAAGVVYAEGTSESVGRKPQIVLIEHNPWLMVIGSDSPTFAMYDDGLVIFLRRSGDRNAKYVSAKLDEEAKGRFIQALPVRQFGQLRDEYTISDWTDQPTNVLSVWTEGRLKRVSVYGDIREVKKEDVPEAADESVREFLAANKETRSKTPTAFLEIFDRLVTYESDAASSWLPEKIEVVVWPYEYSPEEPVRWPEGWPDTKHPETRQRMDSYSIFLDATHFEALKGLLQGLGQKQAVLVNDRKWAISYRFPFPEERFWME